MGVGKEGTLLAKEIDILVFQLVSFLQFSQ